MEVGAEEDDHLAPTTPDLLVTEQYALQSSNAAVPSTAQPAHPVPTLKAPALLLKQPASAPKAKPFDGMLEDSTVS